MQLSKPAQASPKNANTSISIFICYSNNSTYISSKFKMNQFGRFGGTLVTNQSGLLIYNITYYTDSI